jgi:hypothetical protein
MAADDDIIAKLRDARPSYQDGRGLRGNQPDSDLAVRLPATASRFEFKTSSVAPSAPFPALPATAPGDGGVAGPPSANANEYSFELELDSIDVDAYTIDIHVGYGEINDTPPDGMTGADDYLFTIPGAADGTEFYAVITYDTDTLAITSRSLAFDFAVPDSTFGTLYVPLGFVDITYTDGKITEVNPHNRQCGDIVIAFIYGAFNGAPAIFTLRQYGDPQAIV